MPIANTPAVKRYNKRVIASSAFYAAALLGATWLNRHVALDPTARYALAVLPALGIIAIFASVGRYLVEESDEYLRARMARQTLYASGFSMTLATLWGFLETLADAPHVPSYFIACVWFVGLGIGAAILRMEGR